MSNNNNNNDNNEYDFNNNSNKSDTLIYEQSKEEKLSQKNIKRIRDRISNTDFEHIFNRKLLSRNIYIKPQQLNRDIDKTLQNILNEEIGGICIAEGYIKQNSCNILLKSEGNLDASNFKGTIYYTVKYEVMVCNPAEGDIIKCFVSDVNKTNIRAYVISEEDSPLNIFLPKQHNSGVDEFMNIKEGDMINVMVINKKYEYLDREILVIGKFLNIEEE